MISEDIMKKDFDKMSINDLLGTEFECECGKRHFATLKKCSVYSGAVKELSKIKARYNAKNAYIVCDKNTFAAAGQAVTEQLCGIEYRIHEFERKIKLEPDESAVGQAVMDYRGEDIIIGIGGGVINDICKFLKKLTSKPFIIVGTAPSMDGYASDSSSVIYKDIKTTIYTCCADEIICDIDIIKNAPMRMILAGIGDMCAKFVSVCEWRISNLINGEYYCEQVANMMRTSARLCCENAQGAAKREPEAIRNIVEGLIRAGIAMSFAKVSRPASGVEHYYSHLWEMRSIALGETSELHGISVGVGTLLALEKYERLKKITPDLEKARKNARAFDFDIWAEGVKDYFGPSSASVIELEKKEHKYDIQAHEKRITKIIDNWDKIISIIDEELISYEQLHTLFESINAPLTPEDIGQSGESAAQAFLHTRDIRDKYILSRLTYDLGIDGEI